MPIDPEEYKALAGRIQDSWQEIEGSRKTATLSVMNMLQSLDAKLELVIAQNMMVLLRQYGESYGSAEDDAL